MWLPCHSVLGESLPGERKWLGDITWKPKRATCSLGGQFDREEAATAHLHLPHVAFTSLASFVDVDIGCSVAMCVHSFLLPPSPPLTIPSQFKMFTHGTQRMIMTLASLQYYFTPRANGNLT